ncbi:MAG: hypothetical protein KAZ87_02635 [Spirochaetes bacterium]|nr:hypothetical protein [Spirochaetota bacterium]
MQELRIENDNTGFDKPAVVRNVSDMLSSAFKHVPKILKSNLNLIIIMSIAALILAGVMDYAVNYFWAETISRKINEIAGSGTGTSIELARMALKGLKKLGLAYVYFIVLLPGVLVCIYYMYYSYIKKSEAFFEMPLRSFFKYIVMSIVNTYVLMIAAMLVLMIPILIIVGIIAAFSLVPIIGPVIGVLFQIALQIISAIFQYVLMAIISQATVLSVFRKIYPIRCIKLSCLIPFKACGNKKGGFFGGNLWRLVLANFLTGLIYNLGGIFIALILFLIGFLIPDKSVFAYLSTGLIFVVILLVMLLICSYSFSLQTAYTIENLYFGNYPYLEEIKNASAE